MIIQLCSPNHLQEIVEIFMRCKLAMEEEKIFQWTDAYPNKNILSQDIANGHLYSLFDQQKCLGVICLNQIADARYSTINWEDSDGNWLIIHRLAISPAQQKQGFATKLIDFAEEYTLKKGFTSIRLDAYSTNKHALRFYQKRGYVKKGEVYFAGRELPFFCFEKGFRI